MGKIPNHAKDHTNSEVIARGVLQKCFMENFAKLSWKHLCWCIFFNKVAGLHSRILLIKILRHRCFLGSFVKSIQIIFYTGHLGCFWNVQITSISMLTLNTMLVQCVIHCIVWQNETPSKSAEIYWNEVQVILKYFKLTLSKR